MRKKPYYIRVFSFGKFYPFIRAIIRNFLLSGYVCEVLPTEEISSNPALGDFFHYTLNQQSS